MEGTYTVRDSRGLWFDWRVKENIKLELRIMRSKMMGSGEVGGVRLVTLPSTRY